MRSIKEIYVIGRGPSSSHTMGPVFACEYLLKKYPKAQRIDVTLCGSLALTGKGHLTDVAINETLCNVPHKIIFDYHKNVKHPNTMLFRIVKEDKKIINERVLSIGGGTILTKDNKNDKAKEIYPHKTMKEIVSYCQQNNLTLLNYIHKFESDDIDDYIKSVYDTMENAVERGKNTPGFLPGKLHLSRKAPQMMKAQYPNNFDACAIPVFIASFAVAEENACGGKIVTAPTCGSAGVIPGVIEFLKIEGYKEKEILNGLLIGGLIGQVIKTNASVSGAECGCQAEIGAACSMAAAMTACCYGDKTEDIIQAAEIGLEHSLGLTCDPVDGYVQIPCIERCAMFAMKAINAAKIGEIIPASEVRVNFDNVVKTMLQTGHDLCSKYKETSKGGLAKIIK